MLLAKDLYSAVRIRRKVVLELQQKKGTSWTTIMDWSDSGRRVSFDKGQFVSRGYDYRLKISADIYDSDGELVERRHLVFHD